MRRAGHGPEGRGHYYADLNRGVDQDPRLHMIEGDGRHYLQRTAKTYDLISCDPTHPILVRAASTRASTSSSAANT